MIYTDGGHNPPVVIRKSGIVEFLPATGDMVLGIRENAVFHENGLRLGPGDRLFLYTDGVTEAMNDRYELYGEERLLEECRKMAGDSSREMVERIATSVTGFAGDAEQSDDITMLAVVIK